MVDCRAQVDALIALRKCQRRPTGISGREVAQRIAQLPEGCHAIVRSTAWELLERLPQTNEGDFATVLDALVLLDDRDVADVAVAAIRNAYAMVKEDYVSVLDEFDKLERAVDALMAVLDEGIQQPDRPDLTTTIRALHAAQAKEAMSSIARFVGHPDVAVRGAATMFLYQFDESGTVGPRVFMDQLLRETRADMLELLIDGLRGWRVRPDEAILLRVVDDHSLPEDLRQSARKAMSLNGSS